MFVVIAGQALAMPATGQYLPAAEVSSAASVQPEAVAWDLLVKAASSRDAVRRANAVNALTSLADNPRALAMIHDALKDPEPLVRLVAVNNLGAVGDRSAIAKLRFLLADKSGEVAFAAAGALAQMGDSSGRDMLVEVLTGERRVSGGAGGMGWVKDFSSPTNLAWVGASQAAAILAPFAPIGVALMKEVFTDHTVAARASSAGSLGYTANERVVNVLQKALEDRNWTVRAAAAQALGASGSPSAVPKLMRLFKDKRAEVRLMAAASVIRLQAPPPLRIFDTAAAQK